jgi:hypothetical protein
MMRNLEGVMVTLILAMLSALFGLGVWWYFFDDRPPIAINYQHPLFSSRPVDTRADAKAFEVTRVAGGSVVYIYREICISKEIPAVVRARWVAHGFVWPTADRAIMSSDVGCHDQSYAVQTPTSSPSREMQYETEREYRVNPLRSVTVEAPAVPLTILSPADAKAAGFE